MTKAFFDGTTEKKVTQGLTVRVSLEDYRALKHIAVDADSTLAEIVRVMVKQFLKDYEKSKE